MKGKIKVISFLVVALLMLIIVPTTVSAREMTIEELGKEVINVKKSSSMNYIYVIGKYVFTSMHKLTTQDVMLAARSIEAKPEDGNIDTDDIYKKMEIFRITPKKELKDGKLQITSWEKGNDILAGKADLPDKVNIKYIDYNYVKDIYKVEFDFTDGGAFTDGKKELSVFEGDKIDQNLITGENRPTKTGKQFKEWVKEDGKTPWDFSDKVTENMKLKPTWYDEVNTDELIEGAKKTINEGTKKHGYYYDVDFNEESETVTFNVYDLNKKNSQIEGTGLIGDIVNIVNNANVESIEISNGTDKVTFGKSDVVGGAGPTSAAWKQFAVLLCKLTGKTCDYASEDSIQTEFAKITLGDLVKLEDELTLTITLNKDKARSQNYNVTEDYIVKFKYDAPATISATIPEEDIKELKDKFNYTLEDTYEIGGSEGLYNVTGYITEKDDVKNFGTSTTKFYFAYTITLDDNVDYNNVKVKIPKKPKKDEEKNELTDNDYNIVDKLTSNQITVLMEVEENEEVRYRDVIIEIDGVPTKIRIDFTDLKLEKNSKFEVTKNLPESAKTQIKSTFESWGFKPEEIVDFSTYRDGINISEVDDNNVKISGLLPLMKLSSSSGFGEDATKNYGYYIVYVIKTEKSVDKSNGSSEYKDVTVTIPQASDTDLMNPSKVVTRDSFDTNNEIAILMKITPKTNKEDQKFKVIVDMDGNGDKCAPYEVIVDYSELEFQQETKANITIDGSSTTTSIPTTDKQQLSNWGYKFPDDIVLSEDNSSHENDKLSYDASTGLLTGTIKEQKLTGGFNSDELDSYFYTFTIKPEKVTENIKVKIENKDGITKEFNYNDFTEENGERILTVLQHIPSDFAKCTESDCCNGTGKCEKADKCKKALKITIDADGDANNNYKQSEVYYIDYCNVDFVKLHTVEFTNNGENILSETVYDGEKAKGPENNPESTLHFNTFDYWAQEAEKDKFDLSTSEITEDITLSPIWSVDVDEYIQGALDIINQRDNVKNNFNITLDKNEKTLTVNILNNDTKISDISKTAIVSALAHALASDEVDDISIELGNEEAELSRENLTGEENAIKSQIKQKILDALEKLFAEEKLEDKTLKDLCDKCPTSEEDRISKNALTVFLNNKIAHAEGKSIDEGVNYEIKFERKYEISFDTGVIAAPESKYVNKGSTLTEEELPTPTITENYRTFDGWYNTSSGGTKVEKLEDVKEDVNLTAHYKLNVDEFITEVITDLNEKKETDYSDNFDGKFHLSKDKNNITINVDDANIKLSELADTSIPGTIAYILEKNEIKGITLTVGTQNVEYKAEYEANNEKEYTDDSNRELLGEEGLKLKQEIVKGAKGAFDKELNEHEKDATLDQLEYANKEFKIKIGSVDDTVTLIDENKEPVTSEEDKTYTFNFDSDFAVVNQNPTSELGAKTIKEAVESGKGYTTVYIDDTDYTEENAIEINVNHEVAIKPVKDAEDTTVTAKGDYAIDITSTGGKTVTISDLKITGGKYGELKVEKDAKVNVANIDVSGEIEASQKSDENADIHAAIVVYGELNAEKIKNSNEKYSVPTIESVTGKVVISDNMTRNNKYYITKKEEGTKFDTIEKTYSGSFYYLDSKNSQIYFMTVIDNEKSNGSVDFFKIYNYDDNVDFTSLGYTVGNTNEAGDKIFEKLRVENTSKEITDDNQKAQDVLKSHDTNKVIAVYKVKPKAVVNLQQVNGLTATENKISGTLSTQNKEGKFMIPVTLSSEYFEDGKSTVKVTNPNGEEKTYTYSSDNENGIATVSTVNTMKLELEAIKTSKITGNKGKVYEITVDVDGTGNEYDEEVYTVDYNEVNTLEEKINQAAKNTLEANSFTVKKNNKINNYTETFTYEYNKDDGLTYLVSNNGDNVEEYTFSVKYADAALGSSKLSVVARKKVENQEDSGVYLNDWVYVHPQQVGRAIHEVSMLTDVMKDSKTAINAIDTVELVDEAAHKYTVELNGDKYTDWVNNNYRLTSKYTTTEWGETVLVDVELDDNEQYIKSIKTHQESSSNTFDVTFTKVNDTTIKEPKEFLAKQGEKLTDENIKNFYESGKEWWEKHIYEDAYKQQ